MCKALVHLEPLRSAIVKFSQVMIEFKVKITLLLRNKHQFCSQGNIVEGGHQEDVTLATQNLNLAIRGSSLPSLFLKCMSCTLYPQ